MLNPICKTAFFSGLMLWGVSSPASNVKSIKDYANLSGLVEQMRIAARGGASLEYFDYLEDFERMPSNNCERVNDDEVIHEFVEVLGEVLYEDKASQTKIIKDKRRELMEFRRLVGTQDYLRCERSFSERMSLTHLVSFESLDQSYRFQWERGYED